MTFQNIRWKDKDNENVWWHLQYNDDRTGGVVLFATWQGYTGNYHQGPFVVPFWVLDEIQKRLATSV